MESNIGGQRVLEPDPRQEAVQHIDAAVTVSELAPNEIASRRGPLGIR
jgi:hypothetical protein